jgi:hypothetical protein
MVINMADKKFLDAMKQKFTEDPTEKRTQFYNMGGWTQSERKSAFVKEGKEIAEKVFWLMETIEEETFEGISPEEQQQLFSILKRVRENLDRHCAEHGGE